MQHKRKFSKMIHRFTIKVGCVFPMVFPSIEMITIGDLDGTSRKTWNFENSRKSQSVL